MMTPAAFPRRYLLLVLGVALLARTLLLASASVSLHADEAIIGLMARHILDGARPTFFYGQAYMGSLDPWLVALGFRLLGDSVLTIRLVQSALYLVVVALGFALAWRISGRPLIALTTGLLLAAPTVNTALYTTATLGGYNETLILGSLILIWGYAVSHEQRGSAWRWGMLGLVGGLGWWTNGLIVAFAAPVGLMLLYRWWKPTQPDGLSRQRLIALALLAVAGFVIGSAPWWIFDIQTGGAAISTFLRSQQTGQFAGIGINYVPPEQRALGLAVIGLPTLLGMRFPWSSTYFALPLGVAVLLIVVIAIYWLLRRANPFRPDGRWLALGIPGLFFLIFVASTFGADPTGRYFLPLALPVALVIAALVESLHQAAAPRYRLAVLGIPLFLLAYQGLGQITAARSAPGLTTQFDLVSHIPNDHDDELIAFLDEQNIQHGYSNYWVTFRLAFLTDERIQFSAALPYKADLSYNPADNRYPPYVQAVESAERIAIITTQLPELDAQLEVMLDEQGLSYQQRQIGLFHIYYDFVPERPQLRLILNS